MKIEIKRRKPETIITDNGRDGYDVEEAFWFRIVADNGQVLATSEMYTAKHNAIGGARAVVAGCVAGAGLKPAPDAWDPASLFVDCTDE